MARTTTLASGDESLGRLEALLDVNTELGQFDASGTLRDDGGGRAVREVLDDVAQSAEEVRERLAAIVHEWRAERGPSRSVPVRVRSLSPRELVESWLAIKESSATVYREAAAVAPSGALAEALLVLAESEETSAGRLRTLL